MAKRNRKKSTVKTKKPEPVSKPKSIPLWQKHPNLFALGLLIILLGIFYYPLLFEGKTFLMPDSLASKSFTPFVQDALSRGIYPLWNPYIFGGMPSFASLSTAPFMNITSNLIVYTIKAITFWQVDPSQTFLRIFVLYFLFGGAIYLLLKQKGISTTVSFFGSVAMVFMPQVVMYAAAGHNTKLGTAMFIPVIFLLVDRILTKRTLLNFSLLSLAIGMQFLWKHVQIIYYTQMAVGLFVIFWAIWTWRQEKDFKKILAGFGSTYGAVLMGALIGAVVYLSVWEYSHFSIRGGGETGGMDFGTATGWSFPPSEILTYFIPSFMGFGKETYWGPMPFTDFPLYFGIIIFTLAGLSLIINRNKYTVYFIVLAVIALFVSFGKHLPLLYGPMFKFLPLFNKFRAPKMIQILLQISMVIMACYGFQGLINRGKFYKNEVDNKVIYRYLTIFGSIVGILFLILLLGKSAYLGWASKAGRYSEVAYDKALGDGFKAVILFGATFFFIHLNLKKKMNPNLLPVLLLVLLIWDFWSVDKRFTDPRPDSDTRRYFQVDRSVQYLKDQEGTFRIFSVADQRSPNWYMYHKLQHVSGYQGAKLRIYQELIDAFNMPNGFIQKYIKVENGQYVLKSQDDISPLQFKRDQNFLKLMNAEYVLSPYQLPDTSLQLLVPPERQGSLGVFKFKDCLPRIYFPKSVIPAEGKQNILNYMTSQKFDPAEATVIEQKVDWQVKSSQENKAQIESYDIHKIKINASIQTPSLMVLSDIYYPAGWKVYVDGIESTIYKTNYAFRSVFLEPGEHEVLYSFEPQMFKTGLYISITVLGLLLAGLIVGWRLNQKSEIKNQEVEEAA
ncbi:YfhO family protein [candidate division KSB1 bacterium]|nr:YfhO family protein [candidate division KSB1 bacterium]